MAFVRSRRAAETVSLTARRLLGEVAPELAGRVAAYRAGYLPEERRDLEADLQSGRLLGVASTTALELGVDVAGLDAVLLAGFPGTRASMWQQAGRAGRAGQGALAVLVARDDPLDTYLAHHPETLFGRPVETTVLDPHNPHVLAPHLCAAAAELPLTEDDLPAFGPQAAEVVEHLVGRGLLRRRATGWFWTRPERASDLADIRGMGGRPVGLVEEGTGRLLGTVDGGAAHATVHAGAVYVHQGETYLVSQLDLDEQVAMVAAADPDWTTTARDVTDIDVVETSATRAWEHVTLSFGTVQVTNQVVSFLRRRVMTGEVLGEEPLDLPPRHLRTRAVWWTVDEDGLARAGLAAADVPGAAHAAEHASIGLLPLFATCDRWDIGGVSTAQHADTGRMTVFVYDGHPGGAGFAERGHAKARRLAGRDPRRDRRVRVPRRLPVLRAVAQVRQRERAAGQGRGGPAARRRPPSGCRWGHRGLDRDTPGQEAASERSPAMLVLGLLLILGAGVITAGALLDAGETATVEVLGQTLTTTAAGVFVIGALTMLVFLLGVWALMASMSRGRRKRAERKQARNRHRDSVKSLEEERETLRLENERLAEQLKGRQGATGWRRCGRWRGGCRWHVTRRLLDRPDHARPGRRRRGRLD